MAWLSVGTSNEDLIQKMVGNGVLREGPILEAFRATDRGDFVKPEDRIPAYADRPFKKGFIHLSAPHMYVTVLKALELDAGKSFLNVGSGSGYLSCLAAFLLGEEGVSHGVEISEGACQFSREKAKEWHTKLVNNGSAAAENGSTGTGSGQRSASVISLDGISFVHANCFDIDVLHTVQTMKYDRIYVGAGCPEARKEFFLSMLANNGILVAPINEKNQMIAVRKFYGRVYSLKPISNVNFAPLLDTAVRPDEEALLMELAALDGVCLGSDLEQSILKVKAAPSSSSFIIHPAPSHSPAPMNGGWQSGGSSPSSSVPSPAGAGAGAAAGNPQATNGAVRSLSADTIVRVRLPALVWAPVHKRHLQFPPEFRRAVFTVLLCNNRFQTQSLLPLGYQNQWSRAPLRYLDRACVAGSHRQICRCGAGCGASVGSLPHQIWLLIFTYANREWFVAPRSEVQALSMELAVERRLRRAAEDRLRRAEEGRRAAEQERDMYRTALMRQKQYMGAAGAVQGTGGSIFWSMGGHSHGIDEGDPDEETEDGLEEESEEEGSDAEEEEEEEEVWDEEEDLDEEDVEAGEGSEEEGEVEVEIEEVVDESDGENDSQSMTVADGGGGAVASMVMEMVTGGEEDELASISSNSGSSSSSSAGYADVMEAPLPSASASAALDSNSTTITAATSTSTAEQHHEAMAVVDEPPVQERQDDGHMMLQHSGESLPTAFVNTSATSTSSLATTASTAGAGQYQPHIWFHGPDSPLTAPWQHPHQHHHLQQMEPFSSSFTAPLPAPITSAQQGFGGSVDLQCSGGMVFGSLSSDITGISGISGISGTTRESSMSFDSVGSSYPAGRHHLRAAAAASTGTDTGTGNAGVGPGARGNGTHTGSRPASDERISDCTDGDLEGQDDAEEGDKEEEEEEEVQFDTDEL